MTRKQFEVLKEDWGYDYAITELHQQLRKPNFYSYPDIKDAAIECIKDDNIDSAFKILQVVNNPPELDSGFYYYDPNSGEPPVNLDTVDLIEKYIGFEE